MKLLTVIMIFLLLLLQYRLWTGNGSLVEVNLLKDEIEKVENENLKERNLSLTAEVFDLKQGHEAIEEIARSEMGMIKDGETFYQIIDNADQQSNSN